MTSLSIVIPTFNRARQLEKVLPSYLSQKYLSRLIVVDDFSSDHTRNVVESASKQTIVSVIYKRNHKRMGAAHSKFFGLKFVDTDYVLIGEDDAWLSKNYSEVLVPFLEKHKTVAFASGRIIYLKPSENHNVAVQRFYRSQSKSKYLKPFTCEINHSCLIESSLSVPFTHALIVSKTQIACTYINGIFTTGNGFREETMPQLEALRSGLKNMISSSTYCLHMSSQDSNTGGQRSKFISYIANAVCNTHKMFKMYNNVLVPYSWHYKSPFLSSLVFTIAYTFKISKKFVYTSLFK